MSLTVEDVEEIEDIKKKQKNKKTEKTIGNTSVLIHFDIIYKV